MTVLLDAVSKIYPGGQLVIRDLRLRVEDGEFFVLLGPSGCGKSTVLRMIAGLETITSGDLWLGGRHANELTPRDRNVAMVFQNSALYPHRSVRDNLAFPLELARDDRAGIKEKVVELARALGIDSTLDRRPDTLSGGQKQRVAIGRAIIRQPSLFLMDEPLSNLDTALRTELRLEIGALARSLGVTTMYVTHDQVEALTLADRIGILRDGVLEDVGAPGEVYSDPATAFVASFLGRQQINLLSASVVLVPSDGVRLVCGQQDLLVPWSDLRVHALAKHRMSQVVLGIRCDALSLTTEPVPGRTLSGTVRALEFHGHEWLAHVEAGVTVADADQIGRPPRENVAGRAVRARPARAALAAFRSAARPGSGPKQQDPAEGAAHVGTHRRAELLVGLGSSRTRQIGDTVHLDVDLTGVLFFDHDGRRIGSQRR